MQMADCALLNVYVLDCLYKLWRSAYMRPALVDANMHVRSIMGNIVCILQLKPSVAIMYMQKETNWSHFVLMILSECGLMFPFALNL
jgi:hypothetical protein